MLIMKKIIVKIYALFVALFAMSACSSEEIPRQESPGLHTCRLVWDGGIGECATTRAARRETRDGDVVYLRFKTGNAFVDGHAVYQAQSGEWELTYNGSLALGEMSTCTAYFLEGISDTKNSPLVLTPQVLVSSDKTATYCKETPDLMKLSAHLVPEHGRIRFKGTAGQTFHFSGVKYFSTFDTKSHALASVETPLELTIGEDGFSPFVFAQPLSDRILCIAYDFQTYTTTCDSPILDAGLSGYMQFPTEDAHNGWDLVKLELPTLSAVTPGILSDVTAAVSAEVTSLGNGTLMDAGFVYAETPNPTVDSQKVACGPVTELSTTLHDLKPQTEYYIRAYAVNERGTNYSEELIIRTAATPTVPTVRTGEASEVLPYSAAFSATIESLGEVSEVTQHGHVWSTAPNPTTAVTTKTQLGPVTQTGAYTSKLTGLTPNTTYYVRAYAVNAVGTSYGEEVSFTTDYAPVELTTAAVTAITSKSATGGGTITSKGGHTVVECGVCWSTEAEPTVGNYFLSAAQVEDHFTVTLTGLKEKTLYYVRSYVRTESGAVFYGSEVSFTTNPKEVDVEIGDYDEEESWDK